MRKLQTLKLKRYPLIITTLFFISCHLQSGGQKKFDSLQLERILTTIPQHRGYFNDSVIKAIEAVDRKYREIADTLYYYKSFRHTILETTYIETSDSIAINPLAFGEKLKTSSIIFYSSLLNSKVNSISKGLNRQEKDKLYVYLHTNFDHFSTKEKKLEPKSVRIKYIKFPEQRVSSGWH